MNRRHFATMLAAAAVAPAISAKATEPMTTTTSSALVRTFSFTFDEVALLKECIEANENQLWQGLLTFLDAMVLRGRDISKGSIQHFLVDWLPIAEKLKEGTWEAYCESMRGRNNWIKYTRTEP